MVRPWVIRIAVHLQTQGAEETVVALNERPTAWQNVSVAVMAPNDFEIGATVGRSRETLQ